MVQVADSSTTIPEWTRPRSAHHDVIEVFHLFLQEVHINIYVFSQVTVQNLVSIVYDNRWVRASAFFLPIGTCTMTEQLNTSLQKDSARKKSPVKPSLSTAFVLNHPIYMCFCKNLTPFICLTPSLKYFILPADVFMSLLY